MKAKGTMKPTIWVFLTLVAGWLPWFTPWTIAAEAPPIIEVTQGSKITANIEGSRLGEVLRLLADKRLLEIKGSVPSREDISIHFADLSLEEALRKLLRGYNYVLFQTEATRPPALMVMGRVTSGGGSTGTVYAAANPAPTLPTMPELSANQTDPAESSLVAEGIPERPVKTRRALPTRLAAHLASFRPMALQKKAAPAATNMQHAEDVQQTDGVSGSGSDTTVPTEPLKSDGPADSVQESEGAQTGEQGQ